MEINIRDAQKIVEVWLSTAEQNDPSVQARLKPLYHEYKKQKYTVAVFRSGTGDLYHSVRDLLAYNKRHMAELETIREKKQQLSTLER